MSQTGSMHPVMRAVDPQHPNRPMSEQEVERINDRQQARFNGDRIDMLNTDPGYAAHAMLQTAKAAAHILSPLLISEMPETALGRVASGAARMLPSAASTIVRVAGDSIAPRLANAGSMLDRVANATAEDGEKLGEAIAHGAGKLIKNAVTDQVERYIGHVATLGAGAAATYVADHLPRRP